MSVITNILEVTSLLLVTAAAMYLSLLLCIGASCLVYFWVGALKPAKKVWVRISISPSESILAKMDEDLASTLKGFEHEN